jgi:hypothetical protein
MLPTTSAIEELPSLPTNLLTEADKHVDLGQTAPHQCDRGATVPSNQPVDEGGCDGADKHVDPGQWDSRQGDI